MVDVGKREDALLEKIQALIVQRDEALAMVRVLMDNNEEGAR